MMNSIGKIVVAISIFSAPIAQAQQTRVMNTIVQSASYATLDEAMADVRLQCRQFDRGAEVDVIEYFENRGPDGQLALPFSLRAMCQVRGLTLQ